MGVRLFLNLGFIFINLILLTGVLNVLAPFTGSSSDYVATILFCAAFNLSGYAYGLIQNKDNNDE